MTRKTRQEPSGGNAPWLNTFADLMNLLLCFFVLLFAMSDVNGNKFEDISISLTNSFGIFDSGGSSIGSGDLISSGISQLNNLNEYFNNMGENSHKSNSTSGTSDDLKKAQAKIQAKMEEASKGMYDKASDLTGQYNLDNYVSLSVDPKYQFVQLSLKGSILFDSGKADIKEDAIPILSRIGDILEKFEGYTIEIEGHTDNVPINNGTYKDNNWLSSARALNAAEYLIDVKKIDPAKLKYSGRGEYEPVASNATADGRAKNRRIEIKIYNEYSQR